MALSSLLPPALACRQRSDDETGAVDGGYDGPRAGRSHRASQFAPCATLTELRREVPLLRTVCTGSASRLPSAPADRGAGVLHADGPGALGTAEDGGSKNEWVAATGAGVARAADTRPEVRREAPMKGHSSVLEE